MSSPRCCEFCGKAHVIQKQEIRYGNLLYKHSQVTEKRFDTFNFSVGKETVYGYQHTADLALSTPVQEEYVEPETCTTATQYSTSHMKITDSNPSLYNSWQDAERRLVTDISRDPNTRLPNVPSPVRRRKKRTVKCKCAPEPPSPRDTPPEPPSGSVQCICPPACQTMTSLQTSTLQVPPAEGPPKKRKFTWALLGLQAPDPVVCGCYVRRTEAMTNLRNWSYLKRDPYMTKVICKCKPPKPRRISVVDVPPLPKPKPKPQPPKQPAKVEEPIKVPEVPKEQPEKEVVTERKVKTKPAKPKKKPANETKPPKKPAEKVKEPPKPKEKPKPIPGFKRVSLNLGGILLKERKSCAPITICDCCCPRKCLPPMCFYSKCDVCPYYSYFCF